MFHPHLKHLTSDYNPIYDLKELQHLCLVPTRILAKSMGDFMGNHFNPGAHTELGKRFVAGLSLLERMTRDYPKPEFNIFHTEIDGKKIPIKQETIMQMPFCDLVHFAKPERIAKSQEKILLVAPMSGHYATLLRGTVKGLLPHMDVYITDWKNARDVHVMQGSFDLDDFVDYLLSMFEKLGGGVHVLAVCQPVVPAFAALSIMEDEKSPYLPASMVLMGGPIDARKSPTEVNNFAMERSVKWFESNFITRVPYHFDGYMRQVYPGFIQLSGFMAMNMHRHMGEHVRLFQHLVDGDGESAEAHKRFYNEYLAVMDLPAEFYLQTVETVFQECLLPKRKFVTNGRLADPHAIQKTPIFAIEGERDDISGRNQTKAALALCKNLPDNKKKFLLQEGVGHYGLFNGRNYREVLVPILVDFFKKAAKMR